MPFWCADRLGFPSGVVAVAMTDRTFGESREVVCRAVSGLPVNAGDSFRAFDLLGLHGRREIVGQSGQCTRKAVDCTLAK